jgi:3-oxoacyl-(acyl-carrier-protein) synthase
LAEISGYAANCGADHLTAPDRASEIAAMRAALADAGLAADAVDLVIAHGTATRLNDVVEAEALREVFGDRDDLAIAAPKSMMGHAMGASGPIGVALAAFSLASATVPPTVNLETPDPACPVSGFVPQATRRELRHAMVNAFAFGGHNAVLVMSRA